MYRIQASLDLTFLPCFCQHCAWSLRKRRNPNKLTIVKCARVGRAVPCDSLGSAALNRVGVLYCCLSKIRPMVEPCNAEHFPKWPRCRHPGSVVPAVDIYYGHCLLVISHLKTHTTVMALPVNKTGPGALGPEAKQQGPAISVLYGL